MEKLKAKLNKLLTLVVIISAVVCISVCVQVIQGKDASLFGFRFYHILTGSMEPTIRTGSNVLVKSVDTETLKVGDIITFISRDTAIYGSANTHRIYAIETDANGQKVFVTKGDANANTDSIYVYPADVKGKVIFYMHSSGFSTFLAFLRTPYGFVTVIVFPVLFLSWTLMKDFKKQVDEIARENAEAELRLEQENKPKEAEAEDKKEPEKSEAEEKTQQ